MNAPLIAPPLVHPNDKSEAAEMSGQLSARGDILTEESYLQQARQGDAAAFCALCRIYEQRLWRQAVLLCGQVGLAEDLAQETLIAGWKSLGRFHGQCRWFTWLCAIMINRHRNLRRRRFFPVLASLSRCEADQARKQLERLTDDAVLPNASADLQERNQRLRQALDALPHRQRQVVYLRFYADESLDGIARLLSCSIGTVKSRLFHGLERLRKMKLVQDRYL